MISRFKFKRRYCTVHGIVIFVLDVIFGAVSLPSALCVVRYSLVSPS